MKTNEHIDLESPQNIPEENPQPASVQAEPAEKARYMTRAIISIVVTVAAWIAANWNGYVAIALSVVAIVVGFMALGSRRHSVRNTAITAIIASAVLLVVLAAFMIVIFLGLKSL